MAKKKLVCLHDCVMEDVLGKMAWFFNIWHKAVALPLALCTLQ